MARVGSAAVCSKPDLFIWSKTHPPGHHGWVMWVMNGGAPTLHKGAAPFVVCRVTYLKFSKQKTEIWNFLRYFPITKKKNLKIWWQQIKRTTVQVKTKHIYRLDSAPPGHHLLTLFSMVTMERTDFWTRDSVLLLEALPSRSWHPAPADNSLLLCLWACLQGTGGMCSPIHSTNMYRRKQRKSLLSTSWGSVAGDR